MKFGLVLTLSDVRKTADVARLAEEAGWDGFFVDPIVSLTAATMITSRIRLGIMVIPMEGG